LCCRSQLTLTNNNALNGTIPAFIGNVWQLQSVHHFAVFVAAFLLEGVGNFCRVLDLSQNKLVESIPLPIICNVTGRNHLCCVCAFVPVSKGVPTQSSLKQAGVSAVVFEGSYRWTRMGSLEPYQPVSRPL
jgi:hypothetical protein